MNGQAKAVGFTLDAGALIALDHHDRRIISLLARSLELAASITIPATALAQALRNPARKPDSPDCFVRSTQGSSH
jgi:hypothetical protein